MLQLDGLRRVLLFARMSASNLRTWEVRDDGFGEVEHYMLFFDFSCESEIASIVVWALLFRIVPFKCRRE